MSRPNPVVKSKINKPRLDIGLGLFGQRHLHMRIHEHLGVSSITGNQIKTSSSIYEHIQQTVHWADNTCFSTICHTRNKCDLPILERFYIKKLKPDLNRQIDNSAFYLIGL